MCITIGGTPTFDVQLQRWTGSAWAPGIDMLLNSNTQACYRTDPLTLADNGAQYRFVVDNPAGEVASNTATVTVEAARRPGPIVTATTLVSRATNGATANNRSGLPSLSADGNIVAFISDATNLVPGFGRLPLHVQQRLCSKPDYRGYHAGQRDAGRHSIRFELRRHRPQDRLGWSPRHLQLARAGHGCRRHQWLAGRVRARSADRHHQASQLASRWHGTGILRQRPVRHAAQYLGRRHLREFCVEPGPHRRRSFGRVRAVLAQCELRCH